MAAAGIVGDVVQLLASPIADAQLWATAVLLNLSDADSKAVQLECARAGAAAALLQLLGSRSSSAEAQQEAAKALRQLAARHAAHRRAIIAQPGSISTLQRILLDSAASARTVEEAICVLRHLTFDDYTTVILPAVPAVVRCLRSPDAELVAQAAALLADLARYGAAAQQAIMSAGGLPALGAVLRQGLGDLDSLEGQSLRLTAAVTAAGTALRTVSFGNPQAAAAAVRSLGLGPGHPRELGLAEVLAGVRLVDGPRCGWPASGPAPTRPVLRQVPSTSLGIQVRGRELGMAGETRCGRPSMHADVGATRGKSSKVAGSHCRR